MKKAHIKFLSFLTAFLLVFATISTSASALQLKSNVSNDIPHNIALTQTEKNQLLENAKQDYLENHKKNNSNSKMTSFNDNVIQSNSKITGNPEDNVRIIVQLDEKSLFDYAGEKSIKSLASDTTLKNSILSTQSSFKSKIRIIDSSAKFRKSYSVLLNGFSLITKRKNIEKIENLDGVKHVSIAKEYTPDMTFATKITNVNDVWADLGIKGQGMVVAIVDSGIDVTHKDMTITDASKVKLTPEAVTSKGLAGTYRTVKVPYGYNYADNNQDILDKNPKTGMHGMHVAGIVAANGTDDECKDGKAIKGVAPEAQLLAMKVFSNNPSFGSAFDDDIIKAIEDSVTLGADVINMSLGSTAGYDDPLDASQIAVENAIASGTEVVISAGNSEYSTAPYDLPGAADDKGTIGSPGSTPKAVTVASYNNTNVIGPAVDYLSDAQNGSAIYTTSEINPVGILNSLYPVVDCGLGQTTDFEGKDLTGKIALIQRGNNTFVEKKLNAQAAGAVGVIIYNRAGDDSFVNMVTDPSVHIPAVFMRYSDGAILKNLISSNLKVQFKGNTTNILNATAKDMSDFSSWGPLPSLEFKPDLTAPGGNIWSTVNNNSYESMSGTSMAAPHTSGIMALIMQQLKALGAKGNLAELAKITAINTSRPQTDPATGSDQLPFSPRRQGSGLIDAKAAVNNKVTATINGSAEAELKQITGTTAFEIKLHNYDTKDLTYSLSHPGDVMTNQIYWTDNTISYDIKLEGASITFDKDTVTVPAGGDASVKVTISLDQSVATEQYVEGFISLASQDNESNLNIPYMGYYGDWNKESIIDAPYWDGNTLFGATGLYQFAFGKYYNLGSTGYDANGYTIFNPDNNAVSDTQEQPVVIDLSFLRNAKTNIINVLSSDQKTILKTLSIDNNIRKNTLADGVDTLNSNWMWDGTAYNTSTGSIEPVPDGQYYIQVSSTIDYPNAKPQNLIMPVKIDNVAPEIQITSTPDSISPTDPITLKFKASDDFSGIDGFAFYVNGLSSSNKYTDNDGNSYFRLTPDSNGEYSYTFSNLTGYCNIYAVAFDNAGNAGLNDISIHWLNFTSPDNNAVLEDGKSVTFNFAENETIVPKVDHFVLWTDWTENGENGISTGLNTSYIFNNIPAGNHRLFVSAIDADGKEIDWGYVDFTVKATSLTYTFDNLNPGALYNTDTIDLTGSFNTLPEVFMINGVDCQKYIINDYSNNGLTFNVPVKLDKEGLNKISVVIKGFNGEDYEYSANVYRDTVAPVVKLTTPSTTKPVTYVFVSDDTKTYKVEGNVQDDLFGYTLYINGSAVESVNLNSPSTTGGKETLRNFSKEIELTGQTNVIEVKAVDIAGNVTAYNVIVIKDNDRSPEITLSSPKDNAKIVGKGVTVSGTISNIQKGLVKLYINGTEYNINSYSSTCTFSKYIKFDTLGEKTITITAVDSFGSQVTTSVDVTLIEKNPPKVTMINPKSSSVNIGNGYDKYTLEFNTKDDSDIKNINVSINGGTPENITADKDGNCSYVIQLDGTPKTYKAVIKVTDIYDNVTTKTVFIRVIKDTAAPAIKLVDPTSTTKYAGETTETYMVKVALTDLSPVASVKIGDADAVNNGNGIYSAEVTLNGIGTKTPITITAKDNLGNTSTKTITITRIADTKAPVATVYTPVYDSANAKYNIKLKALDDSGIKSVIMTISGSDTDVTGDYDAATGYYIFSIDNSALSASGYTKVTITVTDNSAKGNKTIKYIYLYQKK